MKKRQTKRLLSNCSAEYLRVENILQNYDEFAVLQALQYVDMNNAAAVEAFKAKYYLSDAQLHALRAVKVVPERKLQDYRSAYNDIREWQRRQQTDAAKEKSAIDWDDVVFEVDLLKSQEINLDYILELIFENNKKTKDKTALVEDVLPPDPRQPRQPRQGELAGRFY